MVHNDTSGLATSSSSSSSSSAAAAAGANGAASEFSTKEFVVPLLARAASFVHDVGTLLQMESSLVPPSAGSASSSSIAAAQSLAAAAKKPPRGRGAKKAAKEAAAVAAVEIAPDGDTGSDSETKRNFREKVIKRLLARMPGAFTMLHDCQFTALHAVGSWNGSAGGHAALGRAPVAHADAGQTGHRAHLAIERGSLATRFSLRAALANQGRRCQL